MALQTSGAISLNDIHVEAGGSSGTSASINDADIRDLIGKASGAQSSFSEFYGASAVAPFATFTSTYGSIVANTGGKITTYSSAYSNPTFPMRGTTGATYTFPPEICQSGGTTLGHPSLSSPAATSSNPFYQLKQQLNLPVLATSTGSGYLSGSTVTKTFYALDPIDFGYQSVTWRGQTITFHKATSSDVPPLDDRGNIPHVDGLCIQHYVEGTTSSSWSINLAGTVSGTSTDGSSWVNGIGWLAQTNIAGSTITFTGYP